jgi:hypothetical protein
VGVTSIPDGELSNHQGTDSSGVFTATSDGGTGSQAPLEGHVGVMSTPHGGVDINRASSGARSGNGPREWRLDSAADEEWAEEGREGGEDGEEGEEGWEEDEESWEDEQEECYDDEEYEEDEGHGTFPSSLFYGARGEQVRTHLAREY